MALVVDLHTFGYFAHICLICPPMHHVSGLSGSRLEHSVSVCVALSCPEPASVGLGSGLATEPSVLVPAWGHGHSLPLT